VNVSLPAGAVIAILHDRPPAVPTQFGEVALTSATTVGAPVTAIVTDVASD
jgi:hypothetical protein